jgi:hypothetical protein
MANYSEKEIRAFRLKDILSSRMSALKAASLLYESMGADLGHPVETVKKAADEYFEWLMQDQDRVDEPKQNVLPTPTADQQKVLDAVYDKVGHGMTLLQIRERLADWVESKCGDRYLPSNMSNVPEIIEWLNK